MVGAIEKQVLQSQVMERIQQVQQKHPDMQQHYFAIQFNQDRRKLKNKVNESDKIHHAKIGEEEEGKKQQQDPPQEQESTEQVVDGSATSEQKQHDHIDIKV